MPAKNSHVFNYNYLVWRLHEGAKKGHYYVVKHLVQQIDANTRNALNYTPLHQVKIKYIATKPQWARKFKKVQAEKNS